MATQRILPTANDATYNAWVLGGGSSKWAAMDPDDANSFQYSHINVTTTGTVQQGFTKTVPYGRISITSWTTYIGGGKNANSAATFYGMYQKSVGWRSQANSFFDIFIWGTHGFSTVWSSPTNAQIDSTDTIFLIGNTDGDGSHPSYVNYLYADFVFVPAGETFISIWSLVSSLLGTGLILKDMPAISSWLFRNHRIRFDKHEYEEALRLWRGHRFTRYFDLRSKTWRTHDLSLVA